MLPGDPQTRMTPWLAHTNVSLSEPWGSLGHLLSGGLADTI